MVSPKPPPGTVCLDASCATVIEQRREEATAAAQLVAPQPADLGEGDALDALHVETPDSRD